MTTNESPKPRPMTDAELNAALEPLVTKILNVLDSDELGNVTDAVCRLRGIDTGDDPTDVADEAMDRYLAVEAELQARTLRLVLAELGIA